MYTVTIQLLAEDEAEYERFYNRFKDDAVFNEDLVRITDLIDRIANFGAFERLFRPEGENV